MKTLTVTKCGTGFRKTRALMVAGCLASGLLAQPAQAALTFHFNYLNPGQGFNDPILGTARKTALNDAANTLGAYFSNYTATLTYDVASYSSNDGTLASAGSGAFVVPGTFQKTIVQTKILANNNTVSATADGDINWNFFHNWGLGDNVGSTQNDFKSTAMHELLHSFGFLSFIGRNGSGLSGKTPGTADTWSIFDSFLTDGSGNRLISAGGVFDSTKVAALTAGTHNSASVFFSGANATASNGGAGLPIYSPNPWEEGSSISHLDDNSSVTNQSIMNAAAHNLGIDVRTLGTHELAILKDLGYTRVTAPTTAVPLPAAAWFMASGLLSFAGVYRRRKTA